MDELAKKISDWISVRTEKEWRTYVNDDGEIELDEAALLLDALEDLITWMADELQENPVVQDAIYDARIVVQEAAEDAAAYARNPLQYYGMSQKDFV